MVSSLCGKTKSLYRQYRKAKKSGKEQIWIKYRNLDNSVKKACSLARRSYIKNLAEELKENNNPKPVWSFVKSARKGTNNLVSLLVDGVTLTDDLSIAQSMNQLYSSLFTSEDCDNLPNINFDYVVTPKLSNIYCSVNEIEKLLKNLNAYKSSGPNGLSPRILRECASALSPSICT